jgi:outer membrane protein assembly factor BamB
MHLISRDREQPRHHHHANRSRRAAAQARRGSCVPDRAGDLLPLYQRQTIKISVKFTFVLVSFGMKILLVARALVCVWVSALICPHVAVAEVLKWQYSAESSVQSSPTVGFDGTVYVGSLDTNVYAINATGSLKSEKWPFSTNGAVYSSPVIGPDGTLYVGSNDKNIYAIDTAGRLKWNYSTNGAVYSSPVIGPDGTLYVGSDDNNIYAIDTAGRLKWRFTTANPVRSSPVLGPDGTCTWGPTTTISTPSTRREA